MCGPRTSSLPCLLSHGADRWRVARCRELPLTLASGVAPRSFVVPVIRTGSLMMGTGSGSGYEWRKGMRSRCE